MIPVLVLNAGSSSLKYQLIDMDDRSVAASGLVERIGEDAGRLEHRTPDAEPLTEEGKIPDHGGGAGPGARRVRAHRRADRGAVRGRTPGRARRRPLLRARPSSTTTCSPRSATWCRWPRCTTRRTSRASRWPARATRTRRRWRCSTPPSTPRCRRARGATRCRATLADRLRIRRYGFHGTSHAYVARAGRRAPRAARSTSSTW